MPAPKWMVIDLPLLLMSAANRISALALGRPRLRTGKKRK